MALSILDGNQSATTLSTILSSGQHITAHTVVSLGTQAITDMRGAVSGSVVSISNLPSTQTIAGTVTANGLAVGSTVANVFPIGVDTQFSGVRTVTDLIGYRLPISLGDSSAVVSASLSDPLPAGTNRIGVVTIGNTVTIAGTVTANPTGTQTIAGTVTAMAGTNFADEVYSGIFNFSENNQMGVYITDPLPTGTNRIGVVTIGAGTVTLGAGTAQIGSVTASGTVTANIGGIANSVTLPVRLVAERTGGAPTGEDTLLTCNSNGMLLVDAQSAGTSVLGFDGNAFVQVKPVSGSSVTIGNSLTIASLPALVAGTAQIGSVTASISNSVVTFYPMQGTTVSNTSFTSLTSSTTLVSAVAMRESLTVFNEGAGNLHISPGATCTTVAYQVRLSAGDYWECPAGQLSLAHVAVFATAGTARVTQVI